MSERTGYLGLGANVGDRERAIRRALALLGAAAMGVEAVSSLYETAPVGEVLDQPDFLNAAARVRTALEPLALLDACKGVEAAIGRDFGAARHGPRPIDVDVLLLGDVEFQDERLRLPHPELFSRRFVLMPLLELDPDLCLPDGSSLARRLDALGDAQRVERVGAPPPARG